MLHTALKTRLQSVYAPAWRHGVGDTPARYGLYGRCRETWVADDKVADEKRLGEERLSISELEADVAYFDARLALLEEGRVESFHQEAQIKAYRELERVLSGLLDRLRGRTPDQLPHVLDGIQVEEEDL